ncbi:MAG TPA: hypothetical protein VGB17_08065 [Pyrinomonadaceae bacterium]|jgi:hypothetical protein
MRQFSFAAIIAALMVLSFAAPAMADSFDEDTDTRLINAKVVEVTDAHLSVMARSGVEHVIAIDNKDTEVTLDGRVVSLKDLREGDVVTIELDAHRQVKFAKNIYMRSDQVEVARNRRR